MTVTVMMTMMVDDVDDDDDDDGGGGGSDDGAGHGVDTHVLFFFSACQHQMYTSAHHCDADGSCQDNVRNAEKSVVLVSLPFTTHYTYYRI